MKYTDLSGIRQLQKDVLEHAHMDVLGANLCGSLAMLIRAKTGRQISETTIKRLYGFADQKFLPSNFTLDTLSIFCMQKDWKDWQMKHIVNEYSSSTEFMENKDFNKLFYLSPHPMWIFDLKTLMFIEVNQAAIRDYGYSREQFLSMSVLDIRPDEDRDRLFDALNLSDDQVICNNSFRHKLANGKIINVEITCYGLTLPTGKVRVVMPIRRG